MSARTMRPPEWTSLPIVVRAVPLLASGDRRIGYSGLAREDIRSSTAFQTWGNVSRLAPIGSKEWPAFEITATSLGSGKLRRSSSRRVKSQNGSCFPWTNKAGL